jgi:hypothetical protein
MGGQEYRNKSRAFDKNIGKQMSYGVDKGVKYFED